MVQITCLLARLYACLFLMIMQKVIRKFKKKNNNGGPCDWQQKNNLIICSSFFDHVINFLIHSTTWLSSLFHHNILSRSWLSLCTVYHTVSSRLVRLPSSLSYIGLVSRSLHDIWLYTMIAGIADRAMDTASKPLQGARLETRRDAHFSGTTTGTLCDVMWIMDSTSSWYLFGKEDI